MKKIYLFILLFLSGCGSVKTEPFLGTSTTTYQRNVLPEITDTYNLGSPVQEWKTLYLANCIGTGCGSGGGVSTTTANVWTALNTFNNGLISASSTVGGLTVTSSITLSGLSSTSIPYIGVGGLVSQDTANLNYNPSNHELNIGTTTVFSPTTSLFVSKGAMIWQGDNGAQVIEYNAAGAPSVNNPQINILDSTRTKSVILWNDGVNGGLGAYSSGGHTQLIAGSITPFFDATVNKLAISVTTTISKSLSVGTTTIPTSPLYVAPGTFPDYSGLAYGTNLLIPDLGAGGAGEIAGLYVGGNAPNLGNDGSDIGTYGTIIIPPVPLTASVAMNVNTAASLIIQGPPTAGANVTFPNPPDALLVETGDAQFNGALTVNSNTSTFGGPQVIKRKAVDATSYSISVTADYYLAASSTSATSTFTLPAASTAPAGMVFIVKDRSGNAATKNITVARTGGDTIDGATTKIINTNYASFMFISDGSSKWEVN